jgi:hypothetical protein
MPFNFPAPLPVKRFSDGLSYPLNLTSDNRNYFTRMRFIKYQPAYGADFVQGVADLLKLGSQVPIEYFDGVSGLSNMGTSIGDIINLPIPKKVNEMNMMNWSEISLTGTILGAARAAAFATGGQAGAAVASVATTALQIGSSFAGVQLNPFILQYFQRPSFREFSFTWTLAPRNRKESEQINKIINQIKAAQAPRRAAGGFLMEYPDLAVVQFYPADEFQISLKECVIVGVNVDYTPAGPSYIGGTAAPTMVNLTVHLKETKLWWSEEWGGDIGTATAPVEDPLPGFDMNGALNGSMGT